MTHHSSVREARFRETAREAIETQDGPEALAAISLAYIGDIRALEARCTATEEDNRRSVARLRTADDISRGLHGYLAGEIMRGMRLTAHNAALMRTVDRVRKLAQEARASDPEGDGRSPVAVAELEAVLVERVEHPEFVPTIAMFVPEPARDRSGQFSSDDGVVVTAYPLVGWSLVIRQEDHETRRLEPSFLVEERVLPESFLRDIYGLGMRRLT